MVNLAIAFLAPYATVFLGFVVYPFGYALWMASKPSLYADLMADQSYVPSVVNTLVFVGVGVNVKIFLALLLSGFFMRRRWWIRALLAAYVLPWAIATAQACISFHWMLQGDQGLVDRVLWEVSGINGPIWFNNRWLGAKSALNRRRSKSNGPAAPWNGLLSRRKPGQPRRLPPCLIPRRICGI